MILGLFAAAALAAPAMADPYGVGETQVVSRTVHLADVDLHTIDGAKVAAGRIQAAAEYVCGGNWGPSYMAFVFIECRNHAVDRALTKLDEPLVSAALGRSTLTDFAER